MRVRVATFLHRLGHAMAVALGLVALLALVLGPAALGLAAVGDPLRLGKPNNAVNKVTAVVADLAGPVLRLTNQGGGPALELKVGAGEPPLKVDSAARVANLNADKVDSLDGAQIAGAKTPTYAVEATGPGAADATFIQNVECDPGDILIVGGYFNMQPGTRLVADGANTLQRWTVGWNSVGAADAVQVRAFCWDFPPLRLGRQGPPSGGGR